MTKEKKPPIEDRIFFEAWGETRSVKVDAERLDASYCDLDRVPRQFSKLKKLRRLDLSWNSLEAVEHLEGLGRLEYLNVAHNKIADPGALETVPGKAEVELAGNALSGGRGGGEG
jgi:Leucine-rich repeat (LRR) protein